MSAMLLTCALAFMYIASPLALRAGAANTEWERSFSSFRFSTSEEFGDYVPDEGTPLRAVHDAMAAIADSDAESLVEMFVDESRPHLREFARVWWPRLKDRTLELRRQGIRGESAYVGIVGQLGGPDAPDRNTFADVVFLRKREGGWKLTHEILDEARREQVIKYLDMNRTQPADAMDAFTRRFHERVAENARRDAIRDIIAIEKDFGRDLSEAEATRIYQENRAMDKYINKRMKEGTWPKNFSDVMEIYDVEILDPPIAFDITKEMPNPNFDSLLDAVRTTFYLSALQLGPRGPAQVKLLKEGFGWQYHNLEKVDIEGGSPEYLPKLIQCPTVFTVAGLGQVQIRGRISVSHRGVDYQVILYMLVETESMSDYALPIVKKDGPTYIGSGYTYFKRDGKRWIPSQDMGGYIGLSSVRNWKDWSLVYGRCHEVWGHRVEDAIECLKEQDLPANLGKLYGVDECLNIDKARQQGIWSDL